MYTFFEEDPGRDAVCYHAQWIQKHQLQHSNKTTIIIARSCWALVKHDCDGDDDDANYVYLY